MEAGSSYSALPDAAADATAEATTGDAGGPSGNAGGDAASDAASDAAPPADGGHATRPSYNQGAGFFVPNGKLYDANGIEFRIRGVDKLHWDNGSPGLASSKANTVRWNIDFTQPAANNIALLQGGAGKTPGGDLRPHGRHARSLGRARGDR